MADAASVGNFSPDAASVGHGADVLSDQSGFQTGSGIAAEFSQKRMREVSGIEAERGRSAVVVRTRDDFVQSQRHLPTWAEREFVELLDRGRWAERHDDSAAAFRESP